MQIYDISVSISPSLPVWPGDPKVSLERIAKIEDGDEANVSRLAMCVHSGTHIDAPYHFMGEGSTTVDDLSLKLLIGRAHVLHIPDEVNLITADILKQAAIHHRVRRLLLRTRNSACWERGEEQFQKDFVAINPDGASYLVQRGIQVVGVDYLSVAPFEDTGPTHKILLAAGAVIIEGLDLSAVPGGYYTMYCLPIKIEGADGAPARVILIRA